MKKISTLFVVSFFLIINIFFLIPPARSDISLWPGLLKIDIPEYSDDEIVFKEVSITNSYDYEINVISEIENPPPSDRTEGYSDIPDLSWIKVTPNPLSIPANSVGYFSIEVEIPENEQSLHYNESWEVWVKFFKEPEYGSGTTINVKLASKILIHTPTGAKQEIAYNLFIFIVIFGVLFFLIVVYFYYKKKKLR